MAQANQVLSIGMCHPVGVLVVHPPIQLFCKIGVEQQIKYHDNNATKQVVETWDCKIFDKLPGLLYVYCRIIFENMKIFDNNYLSNTQPGIYL